MKYKYVLFFFLWPNSPNRP